MPEPRRPVGRAQDRRDARPLGSTELCASARLWQKVLGENCDGQVFELPDFCSTTAESGAAPLLAGIKPGADRVPAGRDTYA